MKAAERQLRIRQMFEAKDFLDLETLCRELEASESSVRRDLDMLEAESVLRRVYGGAVPVQRRRQRRLRLYSRERALQRREGPHRAAYRRAD